MTRIFVQRGSGGSSSNVNRLSQQQQQPAARDEEQQERGVPQEHEQCPGSEERVQRKDEAGTPESEGGGDPCLDGIGETGALANELEGPQLQEAGGDVCFESAEVVAGATCPPPPPVPPPKLSGSSTATRRITSSLGTGRNGTVRKQMGWPPHPVWAGSQSDSRPTSPKSFGDAEGYNSADEQSAYFGPPYSDLEKERTFENDLKRLRGLEVKKMAADGNCLFRAVADQVYGDPEAHDTARQMCIDYMERERDHFSQFVVENFTAYCKRKRRDKVYGNNIEIQAFSEMYNRPIHIYCYSTEPINIFHGGYNTDTPPIRLSYHHGNHYNSLVDPRRLSIGAGLGLSSLRGANVDKDQVKAAIKAQQDQQIENALLAEGRFYSDLELTEKEIERMVMEASRAEYLAEDRFKQQLGSKHSAASAAAEPSSSGARTTKRIVHEESTTVLSDSIQMVLAMGFSYLQAIEAYSIFGDDVDSMVCYLVETGASSSPGSSRQKGKATE